MLVIFGKDESQDRVLRKPISGWSPFQGDGSRRLGVGTLSIPILFDDAATANTSSERRVLGHYPHEDGVAILSIRK
jgi:hypothetical protein